MGHKTQDIICCGTSKSISRSCRSPTYAWTWKGRDHIIIQGPDEHTHTHVQYGNCKTVASVWEISMDVQGMGVCVCLEGVAKAKHKGNWQGDYQECMCLIKAPYGLGWTPSQDIKCSSSIRLLVTSKPISPRSWVVDTPEERKIQDPDEHMLKKKKKGKLLLVRT